MRSFLRTPIIKLSLKLLVLVFLLDQCTLVFVVMAGIGGEVEELVRFGLALRWIPWLLGVPMVFPLLSRAVPESLEQLTSSASDDLLMPLMASPAALIGYPLNALLWAAVLVFLTRPRTPRTWRHRR